MSSNILTAVLAAGLLVAVTTDAKPTTASPDKGGAKESSSPYPVSEVTVTTAYGGLRGRSYRLSHSLSLDIFLGVPYARPPVDTLRLAKPEPIQPWTPTVRDATVHGAKCLQRIIPEDQVLVNVPFSEDCLFLDIYTTRRQSSSGALLPVMVYIHPGGFYGGSGAKYNFTALALKGVLAVSVSYRLDAFGFLSTQDDVIPGNFALLDAALALDFVKEIVGEFGGNANDVTLFGASAGAAMVSLFTLSPLTKGKFQKAIVQSGAALCPWATQGPHRTEGGPKDMARELGIRLNCSLTDSGSDADESRDLLRCLRDVSAEALIAESVILQEKFYNGATLFTPVVGDLFGVIPETPEQMLSAEADLVAVPAIFGFTTDDGAWLVEDPDSDGVTFQEFRNQLRAAIKGNFRPSERDAVFKRVMGVYLPDGPAKLNPLQLREVLISTFTDLAFEAFIVKQARMFSRATTSSGGGLTTFVYQFNHRPSYSKLPTWYGVSHADEKGFVLGLPPGPDAFSYPNNTAEDRGVADAVTTMWTNFAKFGNPTPEKVGGVKWPGFGHTPDNQRLLLIGSELKVKRFDRDTEVEAWTGSSGLDNSGTLPRPGLEVTCAAVVVSLLGSLLRAE